MFVIHKTRVKPGAKPHHTLNETFQHKAIWIDIFIFIHYISLYIHTNTHIHIYLYTYIYMYVCAQRYIRIHMYIWWYMVTYIHTCVYKHMYISIYACIVLTTHNHWRLFQFLLFRVPFPFIPSFPLLVMRLSHNNRRWLTSFGSESYTWNELQPGMKASKQHDWLQHLEKDMQPLGYVQCGLGEIFHSKLFIFKDGLSPDFWRDSWSTQVRTTSILTL